MDQLNEIWQVILNYIQKTNDNISEYVITSWLKPLKIISLNNEEVVFATDGLVKKEIIESHFDSIIASAFENVLSFVPKRKYVVLDDIEKPVVDELTAQKNTSNDFLSNNEATFATFVEGPSNKFAYRASIAVAENPGSRFLKDGHSDNYNPLFIYGKSGLGKTHLLHAISNRIREKFPNLKILYTRSVDFYNDFIRSLQLKSTYKFREKYNNIDVLLIDDIQFIAGKEQSEEEFFNTFNLLKENNKQIVLTSDRLPKEIQSLTDRLVTRFESGLLADIQPPEFETRCAIIKNKAKMLGFELDDEVVSFIANKIKTNIRQLEGTTNKLYAIYSLTGKTPNISLAQKTIKDVINDEIPSVPVTIDRILDEVSRTEDISVEDIKSSKRNANISFARQMSMYIIREMTDMTFVEIGKTFGKSYSSAMYSINEFARQMEKDSKTERIVNDIIDNVKNV